MTAIGVSEVSVGLFTGSFGLIGDGIDSFADATTSFVVWAGLHISRRRPDCRFRFGYLRAETLYSMRGAIIMAGIGIVVIYQSYTTLFAPRELKLLSMKTEVVNSLKTAYPQ